MLSLLISFIVASAISGTCIASGIKSGQIAYGILGFIAAQVLISFLIRKKINKVNTEMQEMLTSGQKRIHHKINQFQMEPGGNPRLLQQQVEKDQQVLFRQALEYTDRFKAFKKWNLFMDKQISTMRLQFLYQLKQFDEVDAILAKGLFSGPVFSDPLLVGMKMARQYVKKDIKGVQKTFKRYIRWFRNERGALLYGVMSWVLVKQGKTDEARELLAGAKEKAYNETITRNWEMLSNERVKGFSNAGFGDQWYSLYLENPPAPKQQRMRQQGGKRGRGY